MLSNYSPDIRSELERQKIEVGQRIRIEKDGSSFEGLLMPRIELGDSNSVVIKLDNGYNIGVAFSKGTVIKKLKEKVELAHKTKAIKIAYDPGKKNIVILHTGGTIASKIDYRTGGVVSIITPEDLLAAVPELAAIANIKVRTVFQMFSEDFEPEHWQQLAEKIKEETETGCGGIIVTHGTDTMAYTAAALSFFVQNLPISVIIVGSQRSSDRGSSDSVMNLICAAQFIAKSDFSGLAVCMHGTKSDDYCLISNPVNMKKMHASRRDTFRTIDVMPYAKVEPDGTIEFLSEYTKVDKNRKPILENRFDKNIALIKLRPGFSSKELELYEKAGYRGIILEGTGLGHAGINVLDGFTEKHRELLDLIERMTRSGIVICMVSQCPYGRVNMNVYSTGRDLQKAGVIPLPMTAEAAYVKLGWVLGTAKNPEKAKELLKTNIAGELVERIDERAFLY
jgi:glutamyl-tRNA(Gln) amidotransferase subunit D